MTSNEDRANKFAPFEKVQIEMGNNTHASFFHNYLFIRRS